MKSHSAELYAKWLNNAIKCHLCDQAFQTRFGLSQHFGKVHVTRQCDICHKTFTVGGIVVHMKQHFKPCIFCGLVYNEHEGEHICNFSLCDICGKPTIALELHKTCIHRTEPELPEPQKELPEPQNELPNLSADYVLDFLKPL